MNAVMFCLQCGSGNMDVNSWPVENELVCEVKCYDCGQVAYIRNFSLARVQLTPQQEYEAMEDMAKPNWYQAAKAKIIKERISGVI